MDARMVVVVEEEATTADSSPADDFRRTEAREATRQLDSAATACRRVSAAAVARFNDISLAVRAHPSVRAHSPRARPTRTRPRLETDASAAADDDVGAAAAVAFAGGGGEEGALLPAAAPREESFCRP